MARHGQSEFGASAGGESEAREDTEALARQRALDLEASKGEVMTLLRAANDLAALTAARDKLDHLEASYAEAQRALEARTRTVSADRQCH